MDLDLCRLIDLICRQATHAIVHPMRQTVYCFWLLQFACCECTSEGCIEDPTIADRVNGGLYDVVVRRIEPRELCILSPVLLLLHVSLHTQPPLGLIIRL